MGFRNDVEVLFDARPSHPVVVRVKDEHGRPTTAGFLVKDRLDRIYPDGLEAAGAGLLLSAAGLPRATAQSIALPAGDFTVTATRGPEYMPQTKRFSVTGAHAS